MHAPQHEHPAPYRAIGEVLRLEGRHIAVRRALDAGEAVFRGHYPHQPIFPGVYILEAVVQAVRRLAHESGASARLECVESLRFQAPLGPGRTFELECECGARDASGHFNVKARCKSDGEAIAECRAQFLWSDHD
jgi:3-hydroxyacyl-[acyl-carrier-protein] dehydratase